MEKQKLNTTLVYILSIVSIPCCFCAGLGFIPAAIGYFIANSKVKEYLSNPDGFENGAAMKTAKLIAMIALIINILYLIYTIYTIYTVGLDELMERSRQMMEDYGINQ
ncbi:CCC motif membrane protein [Patiriisocius hiemis]|uniref:CCC motif membrane protein n=1 Tax=Patiriisocius hiemis TaxID=3075604 RepID=A0ABU2YB33_9FLAO|nr:CCC motif membrane protein [Constantimarinum sp. W242]MDT0555000.1 CCC motif membrane protein [Constantimarinum sp. W242]